MQIVEIMYVCHCVTQDVIHHGQLSAAKVACRTKKILFSSRESFLSHYQIDWKYEPTATQGLCRERGRIHTFVCNFFTMKLYVTSFIRDIV